MTTFPITPIDRFADMIVKFLDEMPDVTGCDAHRAAAADGLKLTPCDDFAVVGDRETEMQFCAYHWRKNIAGEISYAAR